MHWKPLPLSLLVLIVAGCASTARIRDTAAREAEHLRADAARARYWALQAAQKPAPAMRGVEILPVTP